MGRRYSSMMKSALTRSIHQVSSQSIRHSFYRTSRTREGSEFLSLFYQHFPLPITKINNMTVEGKDWLRIIPTAGAIGLVVYLAVSKFYNSGRKSDIVNKSIKKDQQKVVDCIDVEDLGESTAFCRCWRSKQFPYCDGSHNAHDKATGDNVGPLCLSKKSEES